MKIKYILVFFLSGLFLLIVPVKTLKGDTQTPYLHFQDLAGEFFLSREFEPGMPHYLLVYTDKPMNSSLYVEYAKFPLVRLWDWKNWYLCFYSINIPYKKKSIEIRLMDNNTKNVLFEYEYTDILQKENVKTIKTTINATKKMENLSKQKDISAQESDFFQSIYTVNIPERYYIFPFVKPLDEIRITSPFGIARAYKNPQGKVYKVSYHYGIDFGASGGTPIYASNDGIIRFAGFKDIRGNCVCLDHGWGIYTTYFHMDSIYVAEGDYVRKGEIIGTVGETGSATGPHLHWEFRINNVLVDGLKMIDLYEPISEIIKTYDYYYQTNK